MNIDHKEDTKEWEVFLNTEVEEVQSTVQFSTLVEVRLGVVVGPSIFLDNRSKDLHETWHDCRDRYSKKTDESFFVKKFVNP